jgi:hypothetical protein
LKVLDCFPLTSNPRAGTLDRVFLSVSVPSQGCLGCVAMDVAHPYRTTLGGVGSECLSPVFPWWDGLSGSGGFSEVVLYGASLWAFAGPFCTQGKLPMSFLIAYYQILLGGQICCWFQQGATALLHYHLCSGGFVLACPQQAKEAQHCAQPHCHAHLARLYIHSGGTGLAPLGYR